MLSNFSYLIEGRLAGCAHPASFGSCDEGLASLAGKGIRAVVSLDEEGIPARLLAGQGFDHLHLPVPDFGSPTLDQVRRFVAFVDAELGQSRPVAVHCRAGYGRTGTMLACYLVWTGTDPEMAVEEVRRRRPGSIETPEQEDFVIDYAAALARERGTEPPSPA